MKIFLREIAMEYAAEVYIWENCLTRADPEDFHAWQIQASEQVNLDLLRSSLMCNVEETVGVSSVIENSKIPYIISFE